MTDPAQVESWRELLHDDSLGWFDALWGKSDAAGRPNLLLQHLFDAMAVGELIWDEYLADGPKRRLDAVTSGGGRRVLVWLCGLHDVGKATPAFQSHVGYLADRVDAAGLTMSGLRRTAARDWRHEIAGGRIIFEQERAQRGAEERREAWVWPLIAGHHGQWSIHRHADAGDLGSDVPPVEELDSDLRGADAACSLARKARIQQGMARAPSTP